MHVEILEVTRKASALAAMAVEATAFRDGQRYQAFLGQVERTAGDLPDPAKEDPPKKVWGAYCDDQLVSVATDLSYSAQYEGQVVPLNGVAGVATLPEYRRRGAARAIFTAMLRAARAQGAVFSYLFPFSFAYYDPFGYAPGCGRYRVTCPLALLRLHPDSGHVRHAGLADLEAVKGIYERFTTGINGAVVRSQKNWQQRLTQDSKAMQFHTYIWQDNQGQDRAFLSFQTERAKSRHTLTVDDWAADSMAALSGLLGFLRRYAADYQTLVMKFPLHMNLIQLFPDPIAVQVAWEPCGQIRLLDVAAALSLLQCPTWLQNKPACHPDPPGGCSFHLQVADAFLPENNGQYAVILAINEKTVVHRTDTRSGCDLRLGIGPLATLLLGSLSLEQLLEHPEVTVNPELAPGQLDLLLHIFRQKKQGIYDYF